VSERETLQDHDAGGRAGPAPRPGVVVLWTGGSPRMSAVVLPRGGLEVGRADLGIDDERVSRQHARIGWDGGRWRIRDLGSRNGTWLGGQQLAGDEVTAAGDAVLRLGHTVLLLVEDVNPFLDPRPPPPSDGPIVGPRLRRVVDAVERAARSADSLLLNGPSGAGKEILARAFHTASPGAGGRFVAVNCAAIPEGIAERLLFGARKGAYTGADTDAEGYLASADGGTVFLDELGELALPLQAKLLRVLETREVEALGAPRPRRVDIRVVAATHRDLRAMVAAGDFREDLYFRLGTPAVRVPGLRDRVEDVPALAVRAGTSVDAGAKLHAALIAEACVRPWPGNVRELMKAFASAAAEARDAGDKVVGLSYLGEDAGLPFDDAKGGPQRKTGEIGKPELEKAIAAADGNLAAAARSLGLHRTQIYRLLRKHGLATRGEDE